VAFSCTSPAYDHGIRLAKRIKHNNKKAWTVFGGWHPTALPEEVIKEDCVDQVIVGEGEIAMVKIMLGKMDKIVQGTKLQPNELPWPDRKTIRNDRTIDLCEAMNGQRTASFQLNRGYKVHCKFCGEIGMTGKWNSKSNPIRTRDYDDVLNEIVRVTADIGINYFKFVDATFDRDAQTVIDFCKRKVERGNTMSWECNIHPNFVQSEEVFKWLDKANCNQINVGVESGSPYVLKDIGKGTNIQGIKNVFKWAKFNDINTRAFFLLGFPGETEEDVDLTMELIDEIKPDVVGFTILAPYPGSDFYSPTFHKHVDWSQVDEYSNDVWKTPHFTNERLRELQQMLTSRYRDNLRERQA
jgi:radical SAM superfamily enzyme YgiQ (UPF0313 family)